MSRPRKELDEGLIKSLAEIGCSMREIAVVTKISEATLTRRAGHLVESGKTSMRRSLRRAQIETALAGNVSMLIWLGKNLLGQSDKLETNETVNQVTKSEIQLSPQLKAELERIEKRSSALMPPAKFAEGGPQ